MQTANLRSEISDRRAKFHAVILGTAVGDAMGLVREGLTRRRALRMFGGAPLRYRLVFSFGMTSDDTEHACMTAQSLLTSRGDDKKFARSLSWRLRGWLLGMPAGVGLATARSILKLWIGIPPTRSGVWSAGNGPAMRAAIIGVYCSSDLEQLQVLNRISSRITHSDPAAEQGALAVALAAAFAARSNSASVTASEYLELIRPFLSGTKIFSLIESLTESLNAGMSVDDYLKSQGLDKRVSGYINHTVPAALFCWLKSPPDFRISVESIILAGGDTDSTGAIVGALSAITSGPDSIPHDWTIGLLEWPRSKKWMERLAGALAENSGPVSLFWPGLIVRNLFFLLIVLAHGFRRLLPPY